MRRTLFAAAIALAAALLFLVQPMVARLLLPIVGGSTLVWSAALVFFQAALLCGYLIAHLLTKLPGQRVIFIAALVGAGVLALPFAAPETTPDWAAPGSWVLIQLAIMVGAPFVVMSAASPLLQRWYAGSDEPDAHEPYRLYAASNAGSILGLLSYPFLIERFASLGNQALGWAAGFAALVALVAAAGATVGAPARSAAKHTGPRPETRDALWWTICAAIPSSLLVTMTASITADIAPVPLLWVVPLAAYLASHVWVFSKHAPRQESAITAIAVLALPYTAMVFFGVAKPWWFFAAAAVIVLGVISVAYHGELVRTRPAPEHLTFFYLCTALGGVLGGAFATFGGPALFDTLFELKLELVIAVGLLPVVTRHKLERRHVLAGLIVVALIAVTAGLAQERSWTYMRIPALAAVVAVIAYAVERRAGLVVLTIIAIVVQLLPDDLMSTRSAYGRYRVMQSENRLGRFHELVVGNVSHGTQARDETIRALPLSYYHPSGPVGQVLRGDIVDGPVAVVGLGIGSVAAYAGPTRHVTFIEIDPLVVTIARNPVYFTYLSVCGSNCNVVIGDGRLRISEVADGSLAVLILDAFSGDAIPTHLLTTEAFRMYAKKLRPGGVIMVNGSNMYVDIAAVVGNAGAATGLHFVRQDFWPREAHMQELKVDSSEWILLSAAPTTIETFARDPRWKPIDGTTKGAAWTDDWQNLFAFYVWR